MSTVDEKIVNLRLNNGQFQKGAAESVGALDKLKNSLNFKGADKSLSSLQTGLSKLNVGSLNDATGMVTQRLSAMGIAGVTALANITNRAVDAGIAMAKSFTIDPIMEGFQEYELKMGSIQTILANTARHGTTLNDVSGALSDLNDYADKTIYNFGDMTKNIGLFTNAGIKVEDATNMIQGFSNVAAASGTTAQGAAGAAYQLSQALSAGKVTLMDWKSLTNVGMGNKNMQEGVVNIAKAMGTFKGTGMDATTAMKDFNGSLEKGWLKADVMSAYLEIMAGKMSDADMKAMGLTKTQIKGFKAQAKTAEEAATKVRTFTQLMDTVKEAVGSGWATTAEIIIGDFDEATKLFTAISEAVGKVVDSSSDYRNNLLSGWDAMGGRANLLLGLENIAKSLGAVFTAVGDAFKQIFPPTTADQLYNITRGFKEFTDKLVPSEATLAAITQIFKALFSILGVGWAIVKGVLSVVGGLISAITGGTGGVLQMVSAFTLWITKIHEWLVESGKIQAIFDGIGPVVSKVIAPIIGILGGVTAALGALVSGDIDGFKEKIANAFGGFDIIKDLAVGAVNAIGDKFEGLVGLFNRVKGAIEATILVFKGGAIIDAEAFGLDPNGKFITALYKIRDLFVEIKSGAVSLQETVSSALGSASTGDVEAGLSLWERLADAVGAVKMLFEPVLAKITPVINAIKDKLSEFFDSYTVEDGIALANTAMFMSVYAGIKNFLDNFKVITKETAGVIKEFGGVLNQFSSNLKAVEQNVKAEALLKMALAIAVMAGAFYLLSLLDADQLVTASVAMGMIVVMMISLTQSLNDLTTTMETIDMMAISVALMALGIAILLFAAAVKMMGTLSLEETATGLVAMAAVMVTISKAASYMSKNAASFGAAAKGLIPLAIAMLLLSASIAIFGHMDLVTIGQGIVTLAGVLAILAVAMKLMPEKVPPGVFAISVAVLMLAVVMKMLSSIPWQEALVGAGALAAIMAILVGAMKLMDYVEGGAEIKILATAGALLFLAKALETLGNMSIAQLATAIGAIVVALLAIAGVALLLETVIPIILALAISVGLLGAAFLAIGAGILMFAMGLTMLAALGTGLAGLVTVLSGAIASVIPMVMQQIGLAIHAFTKIIIDAAPKIAEAFVALIKAAASALSQSIPYIENDLKNFLIAVVDTVIDIIESALERIVSLVPDTLEMVFEKISDFVPRMLNYAIDMINALLEGLSSRIPEVIANGVAVVTSLLNAIGEEAPKLGQAGMDMIIKLIDGLTESISKNGERVRTSVKNLAKAMIDEMLGVMGDASEIGNYMIEGLIRGLGNGYNAVVEKAKGVANAALNAAKRALGIASPSKEFIKIGKWVNEGFAKGLKSGDYNKVKATFKEMKAQLKDLKAAAKEDAKKAEESLKKLNKARKKDYAAIAKQKKLLATANAEYAKADKAYKKMIGSMVKQQEKLLKKTKAYNKEAAKYDAALEKYNALKQERTDYKNDIIGQYNTPADLMANDKQTEAVSKAQQKFDEYTESLNDAATALDEVTNKMIENTNTVKSQFDTLPEINEETSVEGYIQSLKDQAEATYKFNEDMAKLRAMGLDERTYRDFMSKGLSVQGFVDELLAAGPDAIAQIDKLNNEVEEQAQAFAEATTNELYRSGMDAAQALYDGLAADEAKQKADLESAGKDYVNLYVAQLKADTAKIKKFQDLLAKLRAKGLSDAAYKHILEQGVEATPFLEDLEKQGADGIKNVNNAMKSLTDQATSLGSAASGSLYDAGVNAAKGIVDGLKKSRDKLKAEMKALAQTMVDTIKKELKIKSPSRVFREIGGFTGKGLVVGMAGMEKGVSKGAKTLGEQAIDGMKKTLENLDSVLPNELDMNPSIRPVLDLTSLRKAAGGISKTLGSGVNLTPAYEYASNTLQQANRNRTLRSEDMPDGNNNRGSVVFNQYNNSPKALPPREIYRQTKNQISRAKGALTK